MLLLADAGFDAAQFLHDITANGAQFLVRSSACRRPTIQTHLPDGSYLARIGYGTLRPSSPCGSQTNMGRVADDCATHVGCPGFRTRIE